MRTLHVISHTHWDREWYQPFQQFRLRLVQLVDGLLELLDADPDFKYFMLDGQTIVLEDYLYMRPENEARLREYIQKGRIIIGPWHILPDMFLVGPESHIRNLLQGELTTRRFGPKMPVGYIPDPFGHPGQVPQILKGFGIEAACLWRGIAKQEPVEFWWQSPDGSRVLMANLRETYSNGAGLQTQDLPVFAQSIANLGEALAAHSAVSHQLIMLGTDHMQPPAGTSAAIAYADSTLADTHVIHSTLAQYIAAVRADLEGKMLPVVTGELRDCKRMHLLPGVLSTRMWIKQRNHAAEDLLTHWAEPFSTWQELVGGEQHDPKSLANKFHILRQAWRLLMENHPHDSICGCSVDQVHEEMKPRFDQVDQIAEELTRQSLGAIAEAVTTNGQPAAFKALVVFNPSGFARTETVMAEFSLPSEVAAFELIDEQGHLLTHETTDVGARELVNMLFDPQGVRDAFLAVHDGMIANLGVRGFNTRREGTLVHVEIDMAKGTPDKSVWERGLREFNSMLADTTISGYHVRARLGGTVQAIIAIPPVPGLGWRTVYVRAKQSVAPKPALDPFSKAILPLASRFVSDTSIGRALLARLQRDPASRPPHRIENEFFVVKVETGGLLSIEDKQTGRRYSGMNRFLDGGDCGDEYNYAPPESDVPPPAPRLLSVSVQRGAVVQSLTLNLEYRIPPRLNRNRKARVSRKRYFVAMPITCRVSLAAGVARVDVHTVVDNKAQDHRLRVHFPVPFQVDSAEYDGHFEIVRRKTGLPEFDRATWIEDPRPEVPQRAFTDITDGRAGLMIANRGLPEVEVLRSERGSEIALTLLRCVGWLSREDFLTRRGQAGPEEATPAAQMSGTWSFDYAIIPHGVGRPHPLAYSFETPLRAVVTTLHPGILPQAGSFLTVAAGNSAAFIVSAAKRAENGEGWIVRGYNTSAEALDVHMTPWRPFKSVVRVNLAEQKLADLAPETGTGSILLRVEGHEIVTVRFGDLPGQA